jgi:Zn ribbon nucleic-acid-binding protein
MGSVIDYIECPNCKQEAFSDFYYKTGEEYINCNNCGYHYSQTFKRDENGKFITEDGTDNFNFDNLIYEVSELKNPFGSYKIKVYHSPVTECGCLTNEEEFFNLKKTIEEDVEIEFCSVSRFIDGKIKIEVLIDNGPYVDSAGFTIEDR